MPLQVSAHLMAPTVIPSCLVNLLPNIPWLMGSLFPLPPFFVVLFLQYGIAEKAADIIKKAYAYTPPISSTSSSIRSMTETESSEASSTVSSAIDVTATAATAGIVDAAASSSDGMSTGTKSGIAGGVAGGVVALALLAVSVGETSSVGLVFCFYGCLLNSGASHASQFDPGPALVATSQGSHLRHCDCREGLVPKYVSTVIVSFLSSLSADVCLPLSCRLASDGPNGTH